MIFNVMYHKWIESILILRWSDLCKGTFAIVLQYSRSKYLNLIPKVFAGVLFALFGYYSINYSNHP
jgi:hypothetical protein